nr:hypothetical protein [Candidatus Cloacimonadota bacterium]
MKKHLLIFLLLVLSLSLMANSGTIRLQRGVSQSEILESHSDGLSARFAIDALDYFEVQSKEGVWTEISIKDFASTNRIGEPKLPLLRKIISVPLGAEPQFRLSDTQRTTLDLSENGILYPIIPAQASVSKSTKIEELPFVVNRDFYNGNRSTAEPAIRIQELGMMRGERLFALDFVPINYNPSTKSLNIVLSTKVEISFVGSDHYATRELKSKTSSVAFDGVLASTIWNYEQPRTSLMRYPTGYVIISPSAFLDALQPFIEWKTIEGFDVQVTTIESIGNSNTQIKNYMQGLWNAATAENPAPSYLLIVGDVAQVATGSSSTSSTHPTDLHYVRLQGTDYLPEMYFGRLSATTPSQVTNQVNKTLMHEQYTMPNDNYLGKSVLIAGVDDYWSPTHANGQINYASQHYFNEAHGITSNTYLYPQSGSSVANIVANVSDGRGYVNYTAHGSTTDWSNPNITINHINSLQNENEYSFVVGNCCLTNKFDVSTCFGEAWLRAENKGGVIYIGGTNSTYWDEDYWWAVGAKGNATGSAPAYNANDLGAYDALFHEHGEAYTDWASTAGSMVVMGNMAVLQSNSDLIDYYWEIYSIMGDPSLIPYIGIPEDITINTPETIFLGMDTIEIVADPYTSVAVSMNGELHGTGLTDASGYLTLEIAPFEEPGTATLVATRSQRKPIITSIDVIPNEGPYVTISQITLQDGSTSANAGDTIEMDLTFSNVGVLDAENLEVTISTESPWVYLLNTQATIEDIAANSQINVSSIFSAMIDQGAEDQHVAEFLISVTDGVNVWSTTRNLLINAPEVTISSVSYFDPNNNGIFEASETINITLNITNIGHMAVESGSLSLVLNSDLASLPNSFFLIPGISIGGNIPLTFDLNLAEEIEDGETIPLGVALDMGAQMINHSIIIPIGAIMEGFESGDFETFPWQNHSAIPWTIVSNDANSGTYSARSGAISHNGNTSLELTMDVSADGEISFFKKVSSESGWDFLKFYIDGVELGSWSGNQGWSEVSYPVSAGSRTFKWTYIKDGSYSTGSDAGWIDDIKFPMSGSDEIPMAYTTTDEIIFSEVVPNGSYTQPFSLRNLGTGDLEGLISVPAEFTLSQMSQILPNDYSYVISPGASMTFTLGYEASDYVSDINTELIITTNDEDLPSITIPITLKSVSNSDLVNPAITRLNGNFPNPFNPVTNIRYSLKEAGRVKLNIYNLKGQLVKQLLDTEVSAGDHQVVWDGKDDRGNSVASGIYFYRMQAQNYQATNKMMLMK